MEADLQPAIDLLSAHLHTELNMIESYIHNENLRRVRPEAKEDHQRKYDSYLAALEILTSIRNTDPADACVSEAIEGANNA